MRSLALPLALCLFAAPFAASAADNTAGKPKQLVMVSFDGAGANNLWQRSRDLARRTNAHFTYFLSCTLVIERANAKSYQGPNEKPGKSNIGFAQTATEARERLGHVWQAHLEGHDISSHTCGHFDGKDWTAADWSAEFNTFHDVLTNAWKTAGAGSEEPAGWKDFVATGINGFRAPYFSTSPGLVEAERRAGIRYDASLVTKGPVMPEEKGGLIRFGLPLIPEGPSNRPIIAMDYNLFIRHSGGIDNPSSTVEFEERAYSAFKAAFDKEYDGDRIPLQIGLHFVEMNGGAYWRAMERLVGDVCGKQDVACVSYSEAIRLIREREKPRVASGL
ncbi:Polysaccharide deacetylase [Neorhizobium galegae bv. officinalis bv. officinalis str. HAMBI 1141]|uniref:Polysaccharide deacetylase n=1 Tax=Neorhizobium galegae bv. officinalis bv. officinalis str. HAMBI 1141 TaxID=1028801 RepID=A0A068TC94_NEOGA|nr:polysaccharide deacetylase [Neorhizobium galegae]CDN54955.1 Polysaccharide deacetylase [Neorhizobium galegae bv. officinalis bv. officinalis str. HAMBI 1141]